MLAHETVRSWVLSTEWASTHEEIFVAANASEVLIDTVHAWGVDTIFGLPGDGINGIMEALRQRQDKVRLPGPVVGGVAGLGFVPGPIET